MYLDLKKSFLPGFLTLVFVMGSSINTYASQNSLLQQEGNLQKQYIAGQQREQSENVEPGTYTNSVIKKLRAIDKMKWEQIDKKYKSKKNSSENSSRPPDYPTRTGIILVTKDDWTSGSSKCPFMGHAAIIRTDEHITESNPKDGVTTERPNNWYSSKHSCYGAIVKDISESRQETAANWCSAQEGAPYNYNYANIQDLTKFYCSQLVWAGYNYGANVDLRNMGGFQYIITPNDLLNDKFVRICYYQ